MTPDDKRFFPADVSVYNFYDFSTVYYLGMRTYIMKEVLFNKQRAINKVRLMQAAHAVVLFVLYATCAAIVYGVARFYGFNREWATGYVCSVPYANC